MFSPIFRTTGADFITSDFDETIFDSSGSDRQSEETATVRAKLKAQKVAEEKARLDAEKAKSESELEVEKEDDPFVTSPFDNSGASNLRDLSLELERQLSNTGADFITSDFDETIFDSPVSDRQSPKKVPSKKRKSMEPEK